MEARFVEFEMPGPRKQKFTDLVLDYTGTLSMDGALLPGVAERLVDLAEKLRITVLTADTFGTALAQLKGLPLDARIVKNGRDKELVVRELGRDQVIGIGNGRNDVPLLDVSGLGIAVIGPEGAAGALLRVADVVVRDIHEALDLIAHPLRLKATLRD